VYKEKYMYRLWFWGKWIYIYEEFRCKSL